MECSSGNSQASPTPKEISSITAASAAPVRGAVLCGAILSSIFYVLLLSLKDTAQARKKDCSGKQSSGDRLIKLSKSSAPEEFKSNLWFSLSPSNFDFFKRD
jgi:hypothetical protein